MSQPDRLVHFRWDLDKTYLRTEFDTLRDLVRTFRAPAEAREPVPGAPALLRELLRRPDEGTHGSDWQRRVTFVSGSPRQMRDVLTQRLALDGIAPDAFLLKPNLSNLLTLRLGALHDQLGYKLEALLGSEVGGAEVAEILFGDDAEQDALVYSLYADVVAGRIDAEALQRLLQAGRVYDRERDAIARHLALRAGTSQVPRILIHLDRRSPPGRFDVFGDRVVPVFNWFQAALVLFADGWLGGESLLRVVESMALEGYTPQRLANSTQDLARRGRLSATALGDAMAVLGAAPSLAGATADPLRRALLGVQAMPHRPLPEPTASVYEALVRDRGRYRRAAAALRGIGWLE